jgi:TP901 family phage tail tape measure protein
VAVSISTGAYRSMKLGEGFIEITPRIQRGFERSFAAGLSHVGATLTKAVTLPLAVAAGHAVKFAADYSTAMGKVEALTNATREEVQQFSEVIRREGPSWGQTPLALANSMFMVSSAGFQGAEAIEAIETAAKGSTSGLGEMDAIVKVLSTAMAGYGAENLTSSEAMDAFTQAAKESADAADEIAPAMLGVIPIAANLGVEFQEVAAAMGALTRTLEPAQAGTALRQLLVTLQRPSQQAATMLNRVGLSAQGLRTELRDEGLLSVLQTLTNRFGDSEEASSALFNNVRALTGFLALTNMESDELAAIFDRVTNATGTLNEAFEVMSGVSGFRFSRALADVQNSLITVGDTLMPIVAAGFERVRDVFQWFQGLDPKNQQQVVALLTFAAALGPALIVIGKLVGLVAALRGGLAAAAVQIGVLRQATAAFGVQGLLVFTPLAAQIAVVVAAIAALGFIYFRATQDSEKLQEANSRLASAFSNDLWPAINNTTSALGDLLGMDWEGIGDAIADGVTLLAKIVEDVGSGFETLALLLEGDGEQAARKWWDGFKEGFTTGRDHEFFDTGDSLGGLWEETQARFGSDADGFWNKTGDQWSRFWRHDLGLDPDDGWLHNLFKSVGSEFNVDEFFADVPGILQNAAASVDAYGLSVDGVTSVQFRWNEAARDNIKILDAQMEAVKDAHGAYRNYEEQVDRLSEVIEANSEELSIQGGLIDLTAEAGRNVDKQLEAVADSIRETTAANVDSQMPMAEVINLHNERYAALVDEMTQLGFAEEEARDYLERLGLIPHDISTLITLQGVDQAESRLLDLLALSFQLSQGLSASEARARAVQGLPNDPNRGFALGGMVSGPGTALSDSILALLSDGEFVIRAAAVQHYGPDFFDALNMKAVPKVWAPKFSTLDGFAGGGAVSSTGGEKLSRPIATTHSDSLPSEFVAEVPIDLGEGIERVVHLKFRRQNRKMVARVNAGTGGAR